MLGVCRFREVRNVPLLVGPGAETYGASMLVGRNDERLHLDRLMRQAQAGTCGIVVFQGEPGIGKTALVDYAASQAGPMRVLRATGIEAETELAFAGLYSLLRPVADYLTALPAQQAEALRAALGLGRSQAAPDRLAVAAGTHALLTVAAEDRALLVLVDDAHWLDPASRGALLFAVRRLDRDPVGCVMTLRTGMPTLTGLLCCDLGGLGQEAAAQLVEAIAGIRPTSAVAGRLHAETGGNPLALVELVAVLTAEQLNGADVPWGPLQPGAAIRRRFAARLDQVSSAARVTLLVAAAAGRCPATEVTTAAARLGEGNSDALGEVEAAGLVRLTGDGVEFCHPLLRSVAYHAVAPAQRRAAHRALAEVQAARSAELAAWHLAAAATGPDEAAAAALDVAAALAASKGAPLAAAAAWERAAELSEAAEAGAARLAEAAEAALNGGDLNRVRRLTQTVPAAGLSPFRARMLAVRGRLDLLTGQMAAAQRELEESANQAADLDPRLAVELLNLAVSAAVDAGLYDRASWVAEQMASLAGRSDETARFLADLACGRLAWWRGDPEHGMQLISQAVSRLEADPMLASSPERQSAICDAWCDAGDFDRARPYSDRAIDLARSTGALGHLPTALGRAAFLDKEMGRWTRTLAHASQALDLARATDQPLLACEMLVYMAEVEAAQGREKDCLQHALEADQMADELGVRWPQLLARRSQALLEFSLGRLEEAITHYDQLRRLAARWGIIHPYYSPIPDLIEAHAQAGALDRARELLAEYVAQVPGNQNPPPAARAARCRGIVAAADFDHHFQEAIALHERGDVVFQHARTRLAYGERLRRAQRRRDARVQLRVAAEIFDRLDARPWAKRARAELRASGESMTNSGDGSEQLTPQELQIALLVSTGRTNAEIGRAVFLSTRTVEFHLSRAYRKLGVASRTELTRLLASAGSVLALRRYLASSSRPGAGGHLLRGSRSCRRYHSCRRACHLSEVGSGLARWRCPA